MAKLNLTTIYVAMLSGWACYWPLGWLCSWPLWWVGLGLAYFLGTGCVFAWAFFWQEFTEAGRDHGSQPRA